MVTSLGIVTLFGLLFNALFTKMKLPGLLGMLLLGVLLGPYCFNILDDNLLLVSADFRKIALIVILLRAGLGISKEELNQVGKTALKMSFIPGVIEGFTVMMMSHLLLGFSWIQGGILGFIIAAVSPAVVVPQMIAFQERRVGTQKAIPTLILASASIDDVVAITIFSAFLGLYSGQHVNVGIELFSIPLSIVLGILSGILLGLILVKIFERYHIRDTKKVLLILGVAILLTAFETALKSKIEIAGLLGVMTIGFILLEKRPVVAKRLAVKFGKVWIFAEILLFVLVGAQVDVSVAAHAGLNGLIIIAIGLVGRSIGVFISTLNTELSFEERLFCVIAYTPKATVQAAIGGIPLMLGVVSGDVMLAIAVLSIVVTAPLGAMLINWGAKKWLTVES
ncbi:cation:proton antiporter domain-containing protein [Fusibacter ferrireducens]|uniref:Cation:proton antiporter n=1 Tax=Fusibacter ferrireducens TaxID=2785058 RepID=A0ABR9ZSZ0_9FIRM|nr:cation:proton antiporter [Fusibacter ferrireducens]MBF4692719.1 cation:proton antiporter [Fusibacter ferrireducens]